MRDARLDLLLSDAFPELLAEGRISVLRPRKGDDLGPISRERATLVTGFAPDHADFTARGWTLAPVAADGTMAPLAPDAADAVLVCLPRAREHARAMLAAAVEHARPGGHVIVDGQKVDGIEAVVKELKKLVSLGEVISKSHGKITSFPVTAEARAALAPWAAQTTLVEGDFRTCPGVFSADGPDRGSMLLAAALPEKLGSKVVDLGAGWGCLSRAILARDGVKHLDLVEAEALALSMARQNIQDERATFHWADATTFKPASLVQTVVMNPPFHHGREADPAIGFAFIAAARRMLAPDGVLWLVANRHLPYDPVLDEHFLAREDIGHDSGFRVIRAIKPRRQIR